MITNVARVQVRSAPGAIRNCNTCSRNVNGSCRPDDGGKIPDIRRDTAVGEVETSEMACKEGGMNRAELRALQQRKDEPRMELSKWRYMCPWDHVDFVKKTRGGSHWEVVWMPWASSKSSGHHHLKGVGPRTRGER